MLHLSHNRKITVVIIIVSATGKGLILQQNCIKDVFFGSLALEDGCKQATARKPVDRQVDSSQYCLDPADGKLLALLVYF